MNIGSSPLGDGGGPPPSVMVATPQMGLPPAEWPLTPRPHASRFAIPAARQRFLIVWQGPARCRLHIDGWDQAVPPSQPTLIGAEQRDTWFPGEYAISIREETGDPKEAPGAAADELWRCLFIVRPSTQYYGMPEKLLELVDAFAPGLSRPFPGSGVAVGSLPNQGSPVMSPEDYARLARALWRIAANPLADFVFPPDAASPEPVLTQDIPENRWAASLARRAARGLEHTRHIAASNVDLLKSQASPASHPKTHPQALQHLQQAERQLADVQQLTQQLKAVLPHRPSAPHVPAAIPPGRARHVREYRQLWRTSRTFRRQATPKAAPGLMHTRGTPELYELWVLAEVVATALGAGWELASAPRWYGHGWPAYPSITAGSQFHFRRAGRHLQVTYDGSLSVVGNPDGLWMAGGHNRPDLCLLMEGAEQPSTPAALILEAKFRPMTNIWRPESPFDTPWPQLTQYSAGLKWGDKSLNPRVLCALPTLEDLTWVPDPVAKDVILLRCDPLDAGTPHRQVIRHEIEALVKTLTRQEGRP